MVYFVLFLGASLTLYVVGWCLAEIVNQAERQRRERIRQRDWEATRRDWAQREEIRRLHGAPGDGASEGGWRHG